MSLTWKKTLPARAGWWWMKQSDGKAVCVEVVHRWTTGMVVLAPDGSVIERVSKCGCGEWAGPIYSPIEPRAKPTRRWTYELKTKDPKQGPYVGSGDPIIDQAELDRIIAAHAEDAEWMDVCEFCRIGKRWRFHRRWRAIGERDAHLTAATDHGGAR